MPDPFDLTAGDGKKILIVGDSGTGKTGMLAAFVAVGFKLRSLDCDYGKSADVIEGLLRSDAYPYRAYMAQHKITPNYSFIPFDIPMGLVEIDVPLGNNKSKKEVVIGPTSGAAFNKVFSSLNNWIDEATGEAFGNASTWGPDTIISIDTVSSLGHMAKVYSQFLNNHPGSIDDAFGRDNNAAQDFISRLLINLCSKATKANVVVNAHIIRVDTTSNIPVSPTQRMMEKKSFDAKGYPNILSRAFSTQIGKFFNYLFIAREEFNRRTISTISTDNITAKGPAWLAPSYPVETGLLEILCALRFQDLPPDFETLRGAGSSNLTSASAPAFGSFGR
jgi:hypothetical protein